MKLKRNSDNWFDIILGGFTSTLLFIPVCILISTEFNFEINFLHFILPVLFTIYIQWKDEYFSEINTKLTEKNNFEIVAKTLNNLNWEYFKKYDEIKLRNNKFYLNSLDVTIITRSKKIFYNFNYRNLIRSGRPAFFFGISTILKMIFIYNLKKELKNMK
ncbi:hypothetical protein [Flavobacterium sp. N2270]|jgi:hypothetical protein|uniref:hypothetical protein n=1 Tax=Flavobacterium sp. N2270 TaxID=2986831 RepID=UPI0022250A23|nr:hypothetical protein [Flavobacterium sp. N2270]